MVKATNNLLMILCFCLMTSAVFGQKNDENFQPNWESLSKHEAAPEWFVDAKLGIYFHWGVYSVPAFGNEWYPRNMYLDGTKERKFHEKNFGKIGEFDYHDFIPMFTGEHFDAQEWADLFQSAGAKFAGPVAQHHDGFAMWDSEVNRWNAADMGPKKDILGELFKALKKKDMKTIATFHHARLGQRNAEKSENWKVGYDSHFPYHPDYVTASTDPKLRELYGNFETIDQFNDYWLEQVNEVVDKYSPDIIWFDSWLLLIPEDYRQKMAAHFFNHGLKEGKEVVTCHKQADMPMDVSVLDFEQGGRRETHPMPWLTDVTISDRSWCYIKGQKCKSTAIVLRNMIDVWSKNGVVLLNVSPRADGVINQEQRKVLGEIGQWMATHGEAVYGTRPYTTFGYGTAAAADGNHGGQSAKTKFTQRDVRFTMSKDKKNLFAFFLGKPPRGKRITMRDLGVCRYPPSTKIKRVILLGTDTELKWEQTTNNFYLTMPDVEMNDLATVFKFELE